MNQTDSWGSCFNSKFLEGQDTRTRMQGRFNTPKQGTSIFEWYEKGFSRHCMYLLYRKTQDMFPTSS